MIGTLLESLEGMGSKPNTIASIMGRLIVQENGCCIWPGGKVEGYGQVRYQGKNHRVHKLIYEHFVGPVPEGKELDHFWCDNRACANFTHVRPVTTRENVLRGNSLQAENAAKTHCKRGHEFTPENTLYQKSGRFCRQCATVYSREYMRERYRRKVQEEQGREVRPISGRPRSKTAGVEWDP